MSNVSKVEVGEDLKQSVRDVLKPLGGMGKYISAGDRVLLKPNFNTADPFPASSDLGFIKAVTELVFEQNPREVIIGDSSTMLLDTDRAFSDIGIRGIEIENGTPQILNFEDGEWVAKETRTGKYFRKIPVPKILDEIDKLILLPCLKTHRIAQFTGSLKISVGFIKPSHRMRLHALHLQEKIADLNLIIHPDLIIMDGRKAFINEGPEHGEIREPNLLLASTERVALDIEAIKVIQSYEGNSLTGINPEEMTQIKAARGLGIS